MPSDSNLDRYRVVASIAHAQCSKLFLLLDQARAFLSHGSANEEVYRSDADLKASRERVEIILSRVASVASAFSTLGMDAEIGEIDLSKCIRTFWGNWTPHVIANIEFSLRNPDSASFQKASKLLAPLIAEHESFQFYLSDVKNGREHNTEVLRFLSRHVSPPTERNDQRISLLRLHGLGYRMTLHGLAEILKCSIGNARRICKKLELDDGIARGPHGAKLYDIGEVIAQLKRSKKAFVEDVARNLAENTKYFSS